MWKGIICCTAGELALRAREFNRTGKFSPIVIGALDHLDIDIKITEELTKDIYHF